MERIQWILQSNLTNEKTLTRIKSALSQEHVAYEEVNIIPFSDALPRITNESSFSIFYGSTTLILNAHKSPKYSKGVFYNDSFRMSNYINMWQDKMLNSDGIITTFEQLARSAITAKHTWFIRPDSDNKSFSGTTMTSQQIQEFFAMLLESGNPYLDASTEIVISKVKSTDREWRSFVVNSKIISTSLYLDGGVQRQSSKDTPTSLILFIEEAIQQYQPHDVFVIDTASIDGIYKIIECNCFNATGFYDHDIRSVVAAVNKYAMTI